MSWYTIREYTRRVGVSSSTVRRQIREGRLRAKKFGNHWYIEPPEGTIPPPPDPPFDERLSDAAVVPDFEGEDQDSSEVIRFSSKALHHYLMLSEKLVAEKDLRIAEKEMQIAEKRQLVAELESYVSMLEGEVARLRQPKPEGWF